jgi:hypothetical protein
MVVVRREMRCMLLHGLFWPLIHRNAISMLKKAEVRSLYLKYHSMGLFPISTTVLAKKIKDLRVSAALFFNFKPRICNTFAMSSTRAAGEQANCQRLLSMLVDDNDYPLDLNSPIQPYSCCICHGLSVIDHF